MGLIVSHVVAMAENRVIGRDGQLPWHIPEDFKLFKKLTMGHALVMGRKTFESIGRPLPGRLSVVVTRQRDYAAPPGVVVCASIDAALRHCEEHAAEWGGEAFVIGGGELFRQSLPRTDKVYLTLVHRSVDGDVTYPELPAAFTQTRAEPGAGDVPFTWSVWERTRREA